MMLKWRFQHHNPKHTSAIINAKGDRFQRESMLRWHLMSPTHLSTHCRSTTPVVTGISQHNYCIATILRATLDRQTDPYTNANHHCSPLLFTCTLMSQSIRQQLQQVPKTNMPQLGAPAWVRSFVAKIHNQQLSVGTPRPPYHRWEKPQSSTWGSYAL